MRNWPIQQLVVTRISKERCMMWICDAMWRYLTLCDAIWYSILSLSTCKFFYLCIYSNSCIYSCLLIYVICSIYIYLSHSNRFIVSLTMHPSRIWCILMANKNTMINLVMGEDTIYLEKYCFPIPSIIVAGTCRYSSGSLWFIHQGPDTLHWVHINFLQSYSYLNIS